MTISSVNLGYQNQYAASRGAYNQKLSPETKAKLEKYGITYNDGLTESRAQALIAAYEKTNETKKSSSNDTAEGKNDLLKKAKQLAEQLGIEVDENESFQAILTKIEDAIKQQVIENKGNISALEELKSLSYELSALQAQSTGSMGFSNNINKTLMDSLEMLSQYNKNFLY